MAYQMGMICDARSPLEGWFTAYLLPKEVGLLDTTLVFLGHYPRLCHPMCKSARWMALPGHYAPNLSNTAFA